MLQKQVVLGGCDAAIRLGRDELPRTSRSTSLIPAGIVGGASGSGYGNAVWFRGGGAHRAGRLQE